MQASFLMLTLLLFELCEHSDSRSKIIDANLIREIAKYWTSLSLDGWQNYANCPLTVLFACPETPVRQGPSVPRSLNSLAAVMTDDEWWVDGVIKTPA